MNLKMHGISSEHVVSDVGRAMGDALIQEGNVWQFQSRLSGLEVADARWHRRRVVVTVAQVTLVELLQKFLGAGSSAGLLNCRKIFFIKNSSLESQNLPDSPLLKSSSAVVKSHHWIVPLQWPVSRNRLGREPILVQLPSHSCTQNEVIVVESTDLMTQTRSPFEASRTKSLSVSGTTFWIIICSSSCSPNGPKSLPAR